MKKIISEKSPLIGHSLSEARLTEKGVLVLGVERAKSWIPIPKANEIIEKDDRLIVYGPHAVLKELLKVPTGLANNEPNA